MNKKDMKKLLGIVIGGTLGANLGMVYVLKVVALGDAHKIISYGQHGRSFYPIGTVAAMVFAAFGYFMANTLANSQSCGNCGGDNPRNAVMCQFCGEGFDKMAESFMVCPSCDKRYTNGARFCPMCAVELKMHEVPRQDVEDPTKDCPACGATNLSRRSACHKCGKPV